MDRLDYPVGSWVHVFGVRERVVAAVEVLREPRDAAYIATLADATVEETEAVLADLRDEGLAVADGEKYDVDRAELARRRNRDGERLAGDGVDTETLRTLERAVRELDDDGPRGELTEYERGRPHAYSSVAGMVARWRAELDGGEEERDAL